MLCLRSVFTSQKEELLDSSTENSNNDFLKCSLPRKVEKKICRHFQALGLIGYNSANPGTV